MGTVVPVPKGKDVGGAFQHIPLCRTASQTRMPHHLRVVPLDRPAASQHAVRQECPTPNMAAACVNPAALAGGSGELHAYLSNDGRTITGTIEAEAVGRARGSDRHAVGQRARDC